MDVLYFGADPGAGRMLGVFCHALVLLQFVPGSPQQPAWERDPHGSDFKNELVSFVSMEWSEGVQYFCI